MNISVKLASGSWGFCGNSSNCGRKSESEVSVRISLLWSSVAAAVVLDDDWMFTKVMEMGKEKSFLSDYREPDRHLDSFS